jgi:uncharacterized membrane protein YagU involved in acid resistance
MDLKPRKSVLSRDKKSGSMANPRSCQRVTGPPASRYSGQAKYCKVTMRCLRATTVAVEKQYILHILGVCVYSLGYSACNAHASHCHLWSVRLYNIFLHYLIIGTIFPQTEVTAHRMYIVIFVYNFGLKRFWFHEEMSERWSKIWCFSDRPS